MKVKMFVSIVVLLLLGCADKPAARPEVKETGIGVVRAIDWYHQIIVHETSHGFVKAIHLCDPPVEFWVGETANIRFYWEGGMSQCDRSIGAERKEAK